MVPILGCETARELLEPFVDGELSTSDQVVVQAHLHTCQTCQARVADMSLIGWSVRSAPRAVTTEGDVSVLTIAQEGVLARVHAEREQSWRARATDLFSDMRMLWPALGATTAVLLCLIAAGQIWRLSMERHPNSFATLLDTWGMPGTDQNPLRIDNAVPAPKVLHDGYAFYGQPERERMVAVRLVVTREGRVREAEVVASTDGVMSRAEAEHSAADVLHVVRNLQFTPAQSRAGRPVAVTFVWMYWQTTAVKEAVQAMDAVAQGPRVSRPAPRTKELPVPAGTRSALARVLSTA
jgi:anti-sigma factor ChrR (cupin superfamily)